MGTPNADSVSHKDDYTVISSAVCPRCEGKGAVRVALSATLVNTCGECGGSGIVVIVDVGGSFETRPAPKGRTDAQNDGSGAQR